MYKEIRRIDLKRRIIKPWGISWSPDMYHGMDHECRCQNPLPFNIQARVPLLVGFSTDGPQRSDRVGIAIFQCDKCFEYFWFHIGKIIYDRFKRDAPQWGKNKRSP
jgi:hypothetical protein